MEEEEEEKSGEGEEGGSSYAYSSFPTTSSEQHTSKHVSRREREKEE